MRYRNFTVTVNVMVKNEMLYQQGMKIPSSSPIAK
jgi:hypothetical protein